MNEERFNDYLDHRSRMIRAYERLMREFKDHAYVRKFRPEELEHNPTTLPWLVTATRGANRGIRFGTHEKALDWVWKQVKYARESSTR